MIISIRNRIKQSSFRYIAFFIFVVLGIGMISIPSLMRTGGSAASWACKINGDEIPYKEFAREIADQSQFINQIRAQYGQYADLLFQALGLSADPRSLAFDILVKTAIMDQLADKIGIAIHADYITESINDSAFARRHLQRLVPPMVFDETGGLNEERLRMFLQQRGMSSQDFEAKLEQNLKQLQLMRFIGISAYVPSFESEQEFIARNCGKSFSYLAFSLDSFIAAEKRNAISDEDAQAFYDQENIRHRRYWIPEKRAGIVYKLDAHNYNAPVSEEQIAQFYDDNKTSKYVLDPIKVEVREISEKQLPDNISLEQVREEIRSNPSSEWNSKWHVLKPFARGDKKNAFEREAFVLQNEGDISTVVETEDGKVIIQLVKRIPRTYKPLATVKNEIKATLKEKYFKKNFAKDIKAVIAQGDAAAVESFITQKAAKKEIIDYMVKNDTHLSQELFGLQKDEYGFFVEGNNGYIVLLTGIKERNLPSFDSIKDVVKADLREKRAHAALDEALQQALKNSSQASFEAISRDLDLPLHHTGMIPVADSKATQDLDAKGLPMRTMLALDKEGIIFAHNGDRQSFLIKVDAIQPRADAAAAISAEEMEAHLADNRSKMQIESVVASLHRNATIETNESIQLAGEEYSE